MDSPLVIRTAEAGDVDECAALAAVAGPDWPASDWRSALWRDVEHESHRLVVAERDGAIAGYGRARLFEPAADAPSDCAPAGYYLTGLYVHPDARRSGLGTALTRARLDWINGRAREAWFFANAQNHASIDLHRRLGFVEVTRSFSFPDLVFEGDEGVLFRARLRDRV